MRTWTRAPAYRIWTCGRCNEVIATGAPLQFIDIGRVRLIRGGCCEPAPPDLPAVIETAAADPVVQRLASVLPFDWKARSTGDREPGEEG